MKGSLNTTPILQSTARLFHLFLDMEVNVLTVMDTFLKFNKMLKLTFLCFDENVMPTSDNVTAS